ncbi:unnamed protein product [Closterium sp. NIES-64]|nr:unnamed protein product [Closterium sp. NIES-64]
MVGLRFWKQLRRLQSGALGLEGRRGLVRGVLIGQELLRTSRFLQYVLLEKKPAVTGGGLAKEPQGELFGVLLRFLEGEGLEAHVYVKSKRVSCAGIIAPFAGHAAVLRIRDCPTLLGRQRRKPEKPLRKPEGARQNRSRGFPVSGRGCAKRRLQERHQQGYQQEGYQQAKIPRSGAGEKKGRADGEGGSGRKTGVERVRHRLRKGEEEDDKEVVSGCGGVWKREEGEKRRSLEERKRSRAEGCRERNDKKGGRVERAEREAYGTGGRESEWEVGLQLVVFSEADRQDTWGEAEGRYGGFEGGAGGMEGDAEEDEGSTGECEGEGENETDFVIGTQASQVAGEGDGRQAVAGAVWERSNGQERVSVHEWEGSEWGLGASFGQKRLGKAERGQGFERERAAEGGGSVDICENGSTGYNNDAACNEKTEGSCRRVALGDDVAWDEAREYEEAELEFLLSQQESQPGGGETGRTACGDQLTCHEVARAAEGGDHMTRLTAMLTHTWAAARGGQWKVQGATAGRTGRGLRMDKIRADEEKTEQTQEQEQGREKGRRRAVGEGQGVVRAQERAPGEEGLQMVLWGGAGRDEGGASGESAAEGKGNQEGAGERMGERLGEGLPKERDSTVDFRPIERADRLAERVADVLHDVAADLYSAAVGLVREARRLFREEAAGKGSGGGGIESVSGRQMDERGIETQMEEGETGRRIDEEEVEKRVHEALLLGKADLQRQFPLGCCADTHEISRLGEPGPPTLGDRVRCHELQILLRLELLPCDLPSHPLVSRFAKQTRTLLEMVDLSREGGVFGESLEEYARTLLERVNLIREGGVFGESLEEYVWRLLCSRYRTKCPNFLSLLFFSKQPLHRPLTNPCSRLFPSLSLITFPLTLSGVPEPATAIDPPEAGGNAGPGGDVACPEGNDILGGNAGNSEGNGNRGDNTGHTTIVRDLSGAFDAVAEGKERRGEKEQQQGQEEAAEGEEGKEDGEVGEEEEGEGGG